MNIAIRKSHVIGIVFGFSQFVQYAVFAALYYFGAVFIKHDPISNSPNDVFVSIFAMMFGAKAAGEA